MVNLRLSGAFPATVVYWLFSWAAGALRVSESSLVLPVIHAFQPGRLTRTWIETVSPARILRVGQIRLSRMVTGTAALWGPEKTLTLWIVPPPRGRLTLASAAGSEDRLGFEVTSAIAAPASPTTSASTSPRAMYRPGPPPRVRACPFGLEALPLEPAAGRR